MRTAEQKAAELADKIARQVKKAAGRGLQAASLFAEGRVKEAASVKAPTRRSKSGRIYATARATPGAPLRVVSGRFRQSITSQMQSETEAWVGSNARAPIAINRARSIIVSMAGVVQESNQGVNYPYHWEVTNPIHQTFTPTINKYRNELAVIVGGAVKAELG